MSEDRIYIRCSDCDTTVDTDIFISRDPAHRDAKEIEKLKTETFYCYICGNKNVKWDGFNAFYIDEIPFRE